MYRVCGQRTGCFEPYLLKMFWVHSNTFSLSLNASSVACYIQRAVQTAEQFMLFQIRHGGLPAPKCFLLSFNGTPHPLSSTIVGAAVVPVMCFSDHESLSVSVFVLQQLCCYTCMQRHFSLSLRALRPLMQARKPVQCRTAGTAVQYRCTCSTLKVQHAQCTQGNMCSLEL